MEVIGDATDENRQLEWIQIDVSMLRQPGGTSETSDSGTRGQSSQGLQ
jgi:hypothetical protein